MRARQARRYKVRRPKAKQPKAWVAWVQAFVTAIVVLVIAATCVAVLNMETEPWTLEDKWRADAETSCILHGYEPDDGGYNRCIERQMSEEMIDDDDLVGELGESFE